MARGKLLARGQRDLPTDAPARTRKTRPVDLREVTPDGFVLAIEVPYYEVIPKARTERQLRWRRRIQKGGTYGGGVITYPLTEIEAKIINGMGALAVENED